LIVQGTAGKFFRAKKALSKQGELPSDGFGGMAPEDTDLIAGLGGRAAGGNKRANEIAGWSAFPLCVHDIP